MSAVKKSVWMRLGVRMELTEEELRLIQESNDGTVIMMNKLKNGEFTINGDSYIPEEEGDDNYWPIPEEIIDKRKKNGERLSDILDDMRVLD